MTVRWLSEHRRVLAAATVLLVVAAAVPATVGGGSSAAQRTRRPAPTVAALASTRRHLAVEQTEVQQLRTLTSRQSLEISSLRAEVRALRRRRAHHNHRK
jgi:septal ring factor EnvC (AmiA/AmiB activator)